MAIEMLTRSLLSHSCMCVCAQFIPDVYVVFLWSFPPHAHASLVFPADFELAFVFFLCIGLSPSHTLIKSSKCISLNLYSARRILWFMINCCKQFPLSLCKKNESSYFRNYSGAAIHLLFAMTCMWAVAVYAVFDMVFGVVNHEEAQMAGKLASIIGFDLILQWITTQTSSDKNRNLA